MWPIPLNLLRRSLAGLRWVYLLPVRFYQVTLSRWLGGHCRFQPTCSQYFIEAVTRKGIVCGTARGLWRICRCNPWSKGGWDPVE
jgi:putative membrane protein insertion efficiency factor